MPTKVLTEFELQELYYHLYPMMLMYGFPVVENDKMFLYASPQQWQGYLMTFGHLLSLFVTPNFKEIESEMENIFKEAPNIYPFTESLKFLLALTPKKDIQQTINEVFGPPALQQGGGKKNGTSFNFADYFQTIQVGGVGNNNNTQSGNTQSTAIVKYQQQKLSLTTQIQKANTELAQAHEEYESANKEYDTIVLELASINREIKEKSNRLITSLQNSNISDNIRTGWSGKLQTLNAKKNELEKAIKGAEIRKIKAHTALQKAEETIKKIIPLQNIINKYEDVKDNFDNWDPKGPYARETIVNIHQELSDQISNDIKVIHTANMQHKNKNILRDVMMGDVTEYNNLPLSQLTRDIITLMKTTTNNLGFQQKVETEQTLVEGVRQNISKKKKIVFTTMGGVFLLFMGIGLYTYDKYTKPQENIQPIESTCAGSGVFGCSVHNVGTKVIDTSQSIVSWSTKLITTTLITAPLKGVAEAFYLFEAIGIIWQLFIALIIIVVTVYTCRLMYPTIKLAYASSSSKVYIEGIEKQHAIVSSLITKYILIKYSQHLLSIKNETDSIKLDLEDKKLTKQSINIASRFNRSITTRDQVKNVINNDIYNIFQNAISQLDVEKLLVFVEPSIKENYYKEINKLLHESEKKKISNIQGVNNNIQNIEQIATKVSDKTIESSEAIVGQLFSIIKTTGTLTKDVVSSILIQAPRGIPNRNQNTQLHSSPILNTAVIASTNILESNAAAVKQSNAAGGGPVFSQNKNINISNQTSSTPNSQINTGTGTGLSQVTPTGQNATPVITTTAPRSNISNKEKEERESERIRALFRTKRIPMAKSGENSNNNNGKNSGSNTNDPTPPPQGGNPAFCNNQKGGMRKTKRRKTHRRRRVNRKQTARRFRK